MCDVESIPSIQLSLTFVDSTVVSTYIPFHFTIFAYLGGPHIISEKWMVHFNLGHTHRNNSFKKRNKYVFN